MPPPPLTIHLFGPLRVLLQGEPLPRVRTRSVEWLLALLVLRHSHAVERSWLAGTLWPESTQSQALKNLRNDLMYLRTALGPESERLQSPTRDTLTLDLDGTDVDVLRFDAAIEAGDEASLCCAVTLHTEPLLDGCYEAWASTERDTREQACLAALETLADAAHRRGDFAGTLGFLRRAEAMDPLSDSTQRHLMRVLADSGDAPAALIAYREHRIRLHREMNVEPDEKTTRLFQQIRAHVRQLSPHPPQRPDVEHRTPANVLPSARPSMSSTPRRRWTDNETASAAIPAALPHPLTQLIGREQEVREVAEHLGGSRLVTLVGAGGVGKTRLAIEVAREVAGDFANGAVFIPLASLSDSALLPAFVAAALGLREEAMPEPAFLLQALVSWLTTHTTLLVIDNCEHLIGAAAALAQTLLEGCPHLCILATSRQRLGLTGEVVCRVPSLLSPDPDKLPADEQMDDPEAYVRQYPAVRLFLERAAMAQAGFRLAGREEARAAAQVCRQLDGIPLAIELAAARIDLLSVGQIAARLDDRFRLLTGGSRTVLPRHQTLRALIDWSYDQLSEPERVLLRYLSVFAGGWTLEAAEAALAPNADEVFDVLASLVDKSLVLAEGQPNGLRYRMLETVREYALERLRESREEEEARAHHADHYLVLAEQARPFLVKPEPIWLARLEAEHGNLRAALNFFAAREEMIDKAVRLTAALEVFWSLRAHMNERRTWLIRLSTRQTPPTEARAQVLAITGWMLESCGDPVLGKQFFAESLTIMEQLSDQKGIANALNGLAVLESDANEARALAETSVAIMRQLGDRQGLAGSLYYMGRIARQIGDLDLARVCWTEANALDEEMGMRGGLVLWRLGDLAVASGDYTAACRFFARFVTERHEIGDRWSVAWGLRGISALALAEGHLERAARILGASLALKESMAVLLSDGERTPYEALREALWEAGGETVVAAAWEAGRAMTYEQGLEFALEHETP
jgi:predicted ATPase/DNA-binding SARP family transcriptional activator